MKYTFTKQEIIKAIKTEPLRGDSFIQSVSGETHDFIVEQGNQVAKQTECKVCAVGAVFRASNHNFTVDQVDELAGRSTQDESITPGFGEEFDNVEDCYSNLNQIKTPFNKLSVLFESLWRYYKLNDCRPKHRGPKMKALRERLVKFVDKEFPSEIIVNNLI